MLRPLIILIICCLLLSGSPNVNARLRKPNMRYQAHVEPAIEPNARRPTPDAYNSMRNFFFKHEESKALGSDIELTERELEANQIIMKVKTDEYETGLVTPYLFNPSQHIFSVLEKISASPLFSYLKILPKGAVLHAHDTALCSTDFLIELTYRDNLWVCQKNGGLEAIDLQYSKLKPANGEAENNCTWDLLSKVRATYGANKVDEYLRERLTLYPTEKFLDNNVAWQQFMTIFGLLDGLLFYVPNWADYYYNAMKEFYADGVQYLEFRTTLPIVSF